MTDEERTNGKPQEETPETPEDRPVFEPEMIQENAIEPEINIPENDLHDYLKKSDEE